MGNKLMLLTAFIGCLFLMAFRAPKKKKVLFFGGSITQMGVQKGGYIDVLNTQIKASGKEDQYELVGAGIGGNKIYDLYLRMEKDVLAQHPDLG